MGELSVLISRVSMAKLAIVGLALMATYVSAATFGALYGDVGNDPPYLQSLSPASGPKQGGTPITIQGAGFRDDARLLCRFSRLDPETETTLTKTSAATYVSSTEISCDSPAWDETPNGCTSCASDTAITGSFYGHTGSRYLRTSSTNTPNEVGVGDFIEFAVADSGTSTVKQYYEIQQINACTGTGDTQLRGCHCSGNWGKHVASGTYAAHAVPTVAKSYNATKHPQYTVTDEVCDMYRYDEERHQGRAKTCTPTCSVSWAQGTQIKLAEPVYRIDGNQNVKKGPFSAYRASKFACTGCKCGEGCKVTVSVTNDGSVYSGNGVGGQTWTGSALTFSVRDIVPTVQYITNGLEPRDSTRQVGPAAGGTTITVVGENFQNSNLLRCYFATQKVLVKAEWVNDKMVTCKTPSFWATLNDDADSSQQANYDGSALNPHTKVHVTNDGMVSDDVHGSRISVNPHRRNDNSYSYIHAPPAINFNADTAVYSRRRSSPPTADTDTYANSFNPGNPFRSTCNEGQYPNEGMGPCYGAGEAGQSEGNDVLFKYGTCYESQQAGEYKNGAKARSFDTTVVNTACAANTCKGDHAGMTTAGLTGAGTGTSTSGGTVLATNVIATQKIMIKKADNLEGPLSHIQLHLEKASSDVSVLEVSLSSSHDATAGSTNTPTATPRKLTSTQVYVYAIKKAASATAHNTYNVFFPNATYMLPGKYYDLSVKRLSGAQDVVWNFTATKPVGWSTNNLGFTSTNAGAAFTGHTNTYLVKGFTCAGCREKMMFEPNTNRADFTFGLASTSSRTQHNTVSGGYAATIQDGTVEALHAYAYPHGAYRSMLAQEFRPKETGTITHIRVKVKTHELYYNTATVEGTAGGTNADRAKRALISVWVTQHGKYGEYVCNTFGGNQAMSVCDVSQNGNFNEMCSLGAVCNPTMGLNGGCGDRGVCSLATTVVNAHRLRPESGDAVTGPCGDDEKCADTMTLAPDHQKILNTVDNALWGDWTIFEFKVPVPVQKHTTYYFNAGVVGDMSTSAKVTWYSGLTNANHNIPEPQGPGSTSVPAELNNEQVGGIYQRNADTWNWNRAAACSGSNFCTLAIKFTMCTTSTANVMAFSTGGEKTGCCSARASPQGADKGATVTVSGRNFFPSDHLRCHFRNEDGTGGVTTVATATKGDYTEATCPAPTHNPHSTRDCTNPSLCAGVVVQMSHDKVTAGPQYMGPKWKNAAAAQSKGPQAEPAYLGSNPNKMLFSEIHVSTTGSDTVGDGTLSRPYQTIQRGVDAANEYDQIVLMSGIYVGLGNRGLRHHGKRIQLKSRNADLHNTVIDCQHAPDGFILNNNKDSDSPFAGHIDTQDIITRNCENLRIYDI